MSRQPRADVAGKRRSLRVTDAEWEAWKRAAGDRGVSAWLCDLANRAVVQLTDLD